MDFDKLHSHLRSSLLPFIDQPLDFLFVGEIVAQFVADETGEPMSVSAKNQFLIQLFQLLNKLAKKITITQLSREIETALTKLPSEIPETKILVTHRELSESVPKLPQLIYRDGRDPYQIPLDYNGVNLMLNPRSGKYERWFNLIRYNADQHFPTRYQQAYYYIYQVLKSKNSEPITHSAIDRLARMTVYRTLTGAELADYANRLNKIPSNQPILPDERVQLLAFKYGKTKLYEVRNSIFGQPIDFSEEAVLPDSLQRCLEREMQQGKERLDKALHAAGEMALDTEMGSDLLEDPVFQSDGKLTKEEYQNLVKRLYRKIEKKYEDVPIKSKSTQKYIKHIIDQRVGEELEKYLPFALTKPYKIWRTAFIGNVQKNYPNRYNSIVETDQFDGFRDSTKIREEVHRAFNQKQLQDWVDRTTYQTTLLGHPEYLPSGQNLRIKPNYSIDNRQKRINQFVQHLARTPPPADQQDELIESQSLDTVSNVADESQEQLRKLTEKKQSDEDSEEIEIS